MISDVYNLHAIAKAIAPEERSSGATYQRLRYAIKGHVDLVNLDDMLKLADVLEEHHRISISHVKSIIRAKRNRKEKL